MEVGLKAHRKGRKSVHVFTPVHKKFEAKVLRSWSRKVVWQGHCTE